MKRINLIYIILFVFSVIFLYNSMSISTIEGLTDKKNDNKHRNNLNKSMHGPPPGLEEDKWILKSKIVPPVCPKCPTVSTCQDNKKCPPCAPCARCPEPAFKCEKVPNYSSNNQNYLPMPILNDFSQF